MGHFHQPQPRGEWEEEDEWQGLGRISIVTKQQLAPKTACRRPCLVVQAHVLRLIKIY